MNALPLVSVIIPTYNRKEYVVKAVDSAKGQTYGNVEIVVIDDGSTDATFETILELSKKDPRIVALKNSVNLGFVATLNVGVKASRGKYIARLDDDDVWLDPKKLEKQVAFMEKNPEYVLVGGGVIKIDSRGKEIVRFSLPESDQDIKKTLLVSNVFAHSAVLYKKESWVQAGGYNKEFGFFADWELWLKLGTFGKLYNFQDFFIYYLDQEANKKGRSSHDYLMRRKLGLNIKLRNNYKQYYPGYKRGLLISLAGYGYSFMPFRKVLWPGIFWLRNIVFGATPYKYINIKKPPTQ